MNRPKITICPPAAAAGAFSDGPFRAYPVNYLESLNRENREHFAALEREESFD